MTPKLSGISIVIPNYNGAHFLESCLKSLLASISLCPKTSFEIILVDNASSDNSVDSFAVILSRHKAMKNLKFKSISLSTNTGFAFAVNRGIEASKYDYVCVCNNDLTVHKSWFTKIVSAIQSNKDPQITTFFGLVLNIDGTKVESRGLKFYPYGKAENIDNGLPVSPLRAKRGNLSPHLIWGASASLVVYHKPTLLKVGLFDERFFAYIEDVDLAYRLNKSGFKTLLVSSAVSYHLGGGTSSGMTSLRAQMTTTNWILLLVKNYSFKDIFQNSPAIFIERLRNLSGLIKSTPLIKIPQTILKVFFQTFSSLSKSPYKNNCGTLR